MSELVRKAEEGIVAKDIIQLAFPDASSDQLDSKLSKYRKAGLSLPTAQLFSEKSGRRYPTAVVTTKEELNQLLSHVKDQ